MNVLDSRRHWRQSAVGSVLAVYWVALFVATHITLPAGSLPGSSDKFAHVFAYALLSLLLGVRFSLTHAWSVRIALKTVAVVCLYGAVDEILQGPVGRHPDMADWIADCAGAACGIGVIVSLRSLGAAVRLPAQRRMATFVRDGGQT